MRLSSKAAAVSVTAFVALSALNVDYQKPGEKYTKVPKQAIHAPEKQAQRAEIVQNARTLLGKPYFSSKNPDGYACTDVYVKSVPGLEGMLRQDFASLADPTQRYADHDRRQWSFVTNLSAIFGSDYDNTGTNPFFTRRIQNILPFQQSQGVFYQPGEITPQPGMAVYWKRNVLNAPSHMGVVTKVKDGKVTQVIHASTSKGRVVKAPHKEIKETGLHVFGFGDVPSLTSNQ